jgi:3-phenylpropionate/trans-cinnamate dioxygenase ferredoxin subunit
MAEWREVATMADFETEDRKVVEIDDDDQICIIKKDSSYFAISAWCSHEKALLALGEIEGYEITCPLHGARFDIRTGRHLSMPAVSPVPSYEVKVEGDRILVKV